MADAKISVTDASGTSVDVDNVTATTDVGSVYRQRVELAAGSEVIGQVQIDPNTISFTSSGWAKKVQEGKAFTAGGKAAGTAGGTVSAHIDNPSGSGKNVIIVGWQLATTTDVDIEYVHEATSDGTVRDAFNFNHYFEAQASVSVVRVGADALTGGTKLSPIGRITSNAPVGYDFMVIVPPGHSFALSSETPGLTEFTLYATVFWYEEAV